MSDQRKGATAIHKSTVAIGRLARLTAPLSPLAIMDLAVLPAQLNFMSNFPRVGWLRLFQPSNNPPTKKRHKMELCEASGKSVGASVGGNRGGTPGSSFERSLSFSQTPSR